MNLKKQLRHLYAYSFASCLRLANAVWVVLLLGRGYSLWQVGLAEGIFHVVSLVAEIPSGMAADLMGRRRSLAVSGVLAMLSGVVMAFSHNFALVCLSMACSALSYNLISGTQEALAYDSLKQAGRSEEYLQIDANVGMLQTFGDLISDCCSLLISVLSFTAFYLLDGAVGLLRVAAALGLSEPVVTARQAERISHPFAGLGRRLRLHITQTADFLRGNHRVARCIAANALINLPCYLTQMYLQQRLSELGFPAMLLGLPLLALALGRWLGIIVGRRLHPRSLLRLYAACALAGGLGTVLAGAAPAAPAVFGALVSAIAVDVWYLHVQKSLNDAYPSDQRATLVSVDSMAYSVLMILASPVTGWIGDAAGTAGAGLCAVGAVLLLAAAGSAVCALVRKAR